MPPSLDTTKATDFLIDQSNGLRHGTHIKSGDLTVKELVQHCSVPAILEFFLYGLKVLVVGLLYWRDVKNKEPVLVGARRHNPVFIRCHDQMQAVPDTHGIRVFGLDHYRRFGYKLFKLPLVLLVTGVKCLVGKYDEGITKVRLKVPRKIPGLTQVQEVLAKQGSDRTSEN